MSPPEQHDIHVSECGHTHSSCALTAVCPDCRSIQSDVRHEIAKAAAVALLSKKPAPHTSARGASPVDVRRPPAGVLDAGSCSVYISSIIRDLGSQHCAIIIQRSMTGSNVFTF